MAIRTGDSGATRIVGTDENDTIYGYDPAPGAVPSLSAKVAASGLAAPLFVTAPSSDPDHIFIVEKGGVVKVQNVGSKQVATFLNVSGDVGTDGEQGLLGLAFAPDYATSRKFYVYMSNKNRDVEIREYKASASDPLKADPASMRLVATVDYPETSIIHRGGWMGFGPDGYLYVATGDGGGRLGAAQSVDSQLGKILRLDVSMDAFPDDPLRNYAVPSDNPTSIDGIGESAAGTGIFAAGLRNPWRVSFDRLTGEMYIGDVGERTFEEINFGEAGANYGWDRTRSGADDGPLTTPDPRYTDPIYSYGRDIGRSVTGGYVYRGPETAFQGQYFFSDFVSRKIWTLNKVAGSWQFTDLTGQMTVEGGSFGGISSMGEDALGNLYMVDISNGKVFLLDLKSGTSPQDPADDGADTLNGGGGNDTIYAGGGNDQVFGMNGEDLLFGMAGNDLLVGGTGADRMEGGEGNDRYVVDDPGDVIVETAGNGSDTVWAQISLAIADDHSIEELRTDNSAGTMAIDLTGNGSNNKIFGNAGTNVLSGAGGDDLVRGQGGDDRLNGGQGKDTLDGGDGDDRLDGGDGRDWIKGDKGADTLSGGEGVDLFKWRLAEDTGLSSSDADLVLDFSSADGDRLDFAELDASILASGNQAFAFIGTGTFTQAGQIRYEAAGSETRVFFNTDSDLAAEGMIRLAGVHALRASDFVL